MSTQITTQNYMKNILDIAFSLSHRAGYSIGLL